MSFQEILVYLLLFTFLCFEHVSGSICSRLHSREARNILQNVFYSAFEANNVAVPPSCPFHPQRDMYLPQERMKVMESPNKCYCDYCGKGFISEFHLDKHFDNRHSDTILTGPDSICLADHCPILRCDIINQRKQVTYWEQQLCKEEAVQTLRKTCQDVVKVCIPGGLKNGKKQRLQDELEQSICSYLTCEKIYEVPGREDSPVYAALYIVVVVIILMSLATYYLITYLHFFDSVTAEEEAKKRELLEKTTLHSYPRHTEIRKRLPFQLPR